MCILLVSQNKYCVSVKQFTQLVLYREIIAIFLSDSHEHINGLWGKNVELLNVKLVVRIVTTGMYLVNLLVPGSFFLILAHPVYKM